jgi:hypothetical protein
MVGFYSDPELHSLATMPDDDFAHFRRARRKLCGGERGAVSFEEFRTGAVIL